jgi:hypothetical protein
MPRDVAARHIPAMKTSLADLLRWAPRILGIAASLFLALFALDAFSGDTPFLPAFGDFVVHLLPAALVLTAVVIAWRRAWIGAIVFVALAVAYGFMAQARPDWILAISGPLFAVGLLFFFSSVNGSKGFQGT